MEAGWDGPTVSSRSYMKIQITNRWSPIHIFHGFASKLHISHKSENIVHWVFSRRRCNKPDNFQFMKSWESYATSFDAGLIKESPFYLTAFTAVELWRQLSNMKVILNSFTVFWSGGKITPLPWSHAYYRSGSGHHCATRWRLWWWNNLFLYVSVVCHTFPSIERIFIFKMAAPSREVSGHLEEWYGWCTM